MEVLVTHSIDNLQLDLKNEIKTLLESGIIEVSDSAWSSPVILVPKANGKRLCVDYRKQFGNNQ